MSWFKRRGAYVLDTTIDPASIPPPASCHGLGVVPSGRVRPTPRGWRQGPLPSYERCVGCPDCPVGPRNGIQVTCACGTVSYHAQACPSVPFRLRNGALVRIDDCGVCDLTPTATGYVRGRQVSCPVHGDTSRERSQ